MCAEPLNGGVGGSKVVVLSLRLFVAAVVGKIMTGELFLLLLVSEIAVLVRLEMLILLLLLFTQFQFQ